MQNTNLPWVTLLFFFLSVGAHSQKSTQLSGNVTDTSGISLFGATVAVKDQATGAVTDANGHFIITGDFSGTITLETSYIGYTTRLQVIDLDQKSGTDIQIILEESSVELDAVTLSAKSRIQEIEALAYNVDVIDAKKLYNSTLDVGHALDKVSGIRVRESGGVGSRMNLSMNGFRGNQVKVFIDGIPMENFGSSFQLNNIPISLAQRIEVYKGVVPVSLGADALGGAINIITNTYEKDHLDLSYSYGSFNTHRTNVDATFVSKSDVVFQINAFQNYSDNDYKVDVDVADLRTGEYFPDQEVRRFHDRYRNETFIGNVGVVNKSYADRLLLGITLGQVYNEVQTAQRLVTVYGKRHTRSNIIMPTLKYQKDDFIVKNLDARINANYNLGQEQVIDTVNRRYNWFGDFIAYDTPGGEQTYTRLKFKDNNGLVNASFNYKVNEKNALSLSNVYTTFDRKRENELRPDDDYDQPQKTFKNILGLSYQYTEENWSTTLFTKNYNQVNNFDQSYNPSGDYGDVAYFEKRDAFNFFGYGLAGSYFITPAIQLKASFEHSYRLPSPQELYGDGGIVLEGNTDLDPERSNNYNLGASYWKALENGHQLAISGNIFYRDAKDFIRPKLNQNQILQTQDNLQDVTNVGLELEASYVYKNNFRAGFNFTYQNLRNNTQFVDGESAESVVYRDRLPNIPYAYGNANASYNFQDLFKKGHSISLGYNLLYVHSFYRYWPSLGSNSGGGKYEIPEQIAHDLNLTYNLEHFKFTVECRNLLDERLYDNFSLQKPGRSFSGKIRYTF
ncbi:MAG TPA: TonB-dependent receptor [Leeuwenhoekiella sp.]|nr:TonB-dependent receptor [Leeuwenhoekiella sp.]